MPSLTSKRSEKSLSATLNRRVTTNALDICFDYEPVRRAEHSDESIDSVANVDNGSTDDLQQLLSAIHKRYKVNSEKQEREFKDSLKQTVKRSVQEFQSHMDKFTATMYYTASESYAVGMIDFQNSDMN